MEEIVKQVEDVVKNVEGLKSGILAEVETKSAAIEAKVGQDLNEIKGSIEGLQKNFDAMDAAKTKQAEAEKRSMDIKSQLSNALLDATDDLAKLGSTKNGRMELSLKAVADMTTANVTGGKVYGAIYRNGIIEAPKTWVHMRETIPVGPAGRGTDYYFMRQNGPGEGAPAPVLEGALKPQKDYDLVEASVPFQTIAAWLRVSTKAMNNIPGLISFINSRLVEDLLDVEDQQILYGTGVNPQLKGILAAGNFVASTSTSTVLIDKILDDISTLESSYKRRTDGIWLRPEDYYSFIKNKATGSGEYDLPQGVVFQGGQLFLWGIPVYKKTALAAGEYVVGDSSGVDFLIQEDIRVELFREDGINVRENMVTIRVEETVALPVYGPDYFIKGVSGATT